MSWILFVVFVVTLTWVAVTKRDYFSPGILYLLVYSFALSINFLGLSRLQSEWTQSTRYFFWGASFLFLSASGIVRLAEKIHCPAFHLDFSSLREKLREDAQCLDWKRFNRVFLFCCAIYLISFGVATLIIGTIPLLTSNPDGTRMGFYSASQLTNIGLFFGPLSLILGWETLLFGRGSRARKLTTMGLMALVLALYITIAMRLDLFRFLVFGLILYHYGYKRLGMRQILVCLVGGTLLFVGLYLLRISNASAIDDLNDMVRVKMPQKYFWASQIYAYVVSNFWNMNYGFSKFVEGTHFYPMSWGFELFRSVFFLLHLEGPVQSAYGFDSIFNDSINFVHGLNSTVYVWHFYKDFGAIGVFLLTFGFGLALALFYRNTLRNPTLFRISLWGLFSGVIIFSLTAALWEFWFMYLNIFVLALAHKKKRPA